jgi:hypothetical protein
MMESQRHLAYLADLERQLFCGPYRKRKIIDEVAGHLADVAENSKDQISPDEVMGDFRIMASGYNKVYRWRHLAKLVLLFLPAAFGVWFAVTETYLNYPVFEMLSGKFVPSAGLAWVSDRITVSSPEELVACSSESYRLMYDSGILGFPKLWKNNDQSDDFACGSLVPKFTGQVPSKIRAAFQAAISSPVYSPEHWKLPKNVFLSRCPNSSDCIIYEGGETANIWGGNHSLDSGRDYFVLTEIYPVVGNNRPSGIHYFHANLILLNGEGQVEGVAMQKGFDDFEPEYSISIVIFVLGVGISLLAYCVEYALEDLASRITWPRRRRRLSLQ